jgi:hypothetical protein
MYFENANDMRDITRLPRTHRTPQDRRFENFFGLRSHNFSMYSCYEAIQSSHPVVPTALDISDAERRGGPGTAPAAMTASLHRLRDLFRRHQRRKIGVGAGHDGEDRGVDHAQALHALDAALGVDHRHRIVVAAHAA